MGKFPQGFFFFFFFYYMVHGMSELNAFQKVIYSAQYILLGILRMIYYKRT